MYQRLGWLVFLIIPYMGYGQIVNIESLRKSPADTIPLHFKIEAGAALNKNTTSIFWMNFGADFQWRADEHQWLSVTDLNLNRSDGATLLNEGFQHIRYNRKLGKVFDFETFIQGQYNEAIKLRVRGLLGVGGRFQIVDRDQQKLTYGVSYMYEYDEESESNIVHRDHRLNNYLSIVLQLTSQASFISTTYFQPVAFRFNDVRLSSQSSLNIRISDRLRFQSAFTIQYDSRNPEGVPPTIYRLTTGLVWSR